MEGCLLESTVRNLTTVSRNQVSGSRSGRRVGKVEADSRGEGSAEKVGVKRNKVQRRRGKCSLGVGVGGSGEHQLLKSKKEQNSSRES